MSSKPPQPTSVALAVPRGGGAAERDGGVNLIILGAAVGEIGCGAERYAADRRHLLAHLVAEQTEISSNTSVVGFEYERIGNAKFLRRLGIVEQELIEVVITAVKGSQRIVGSKGNESRSLPAPLYFVLCIGYTLFQLAAVLSPLLPAHVLYLQPSHLEVEGVLTLQHGGFSDWSCHNKYVFE